MVTFSKFFLYCIIKIIFSQAYKKHKMKFFAPKHSRYIEVSAPTIIFLISSDTFSQTASQIVEINTIKEFEISQTL